MTATWIISISEEGGDIKVTSEITTSASNYIKSTVHTYASTDPSIPEAVSQDLEDRGINATVVQILFIEAVATGQGDPTILITAADSNMLSVNPEEASNGVVVIYDGGSGTVCNAKSTSGKVKVGDTNPI